jgi:hypothetical protein
MIQEETEDGVHSVHVDVECQEAGYNPLKEKHHQLIKDYEDFKLPKKIVETSCEIYMLVINGKVMKRGRRKAMMCKCTYEAYKKHNIYKDPLLLAKDFGITIKQFRKAQEHFYEQVFNTHVQEQFPKKHLTAIELLPDMVFRMNLTDVPINDLGKIIHIIYENSTLLHRTSPRDVTISVLHWYINREGIVKSYDNTQQITFIAKAKLLKNVTNIKTIMSQI